MKTLIQFSLIFLLIGLFSSCKSDANKNSANTATKPAANSASAEIYKITPGIKINWIGRKVTSSHKGTIKISSGEIQVENNTIKGGNFTIDMTSIENTDLDASSGKAKLEGHLKSPDFFDVAKYPTAKFEITKVVAVKNNPSITHNIFGNLTLKDVTKNIGFNTKLAIKDGALLAIIPNFKIDRTAFNVEYGSGKLADAIKDKVILDEIELGISALTAKK